MEAGEKAKDRHLPATLLKMYNCEEEMKVRTGRNMILKLGDGSLTWMKENPGCDVSKLINTFCSWMHHIVAGRGARNMIFSAFQAAD